VISILSVDRMNRTSTIYIGLTLHFIVEVILKNPYQLVFELNCSNINCCELLNPWVVVRFGRRYPARGRRSTKAGGSSSFGRGGLRPPRDSRRHGLFRSFYVFQLDIMFAGKF
jgi:hypothetical protein